DATAAALAGGAPAVATPDVRDVLARIRPGDYVAICAYLPRDTASITKLRALRHRLRTRYAAATTVGFGPRFLHSTGQLHKGGPDSAVVLQLVDEPVADLAIPGAAYGFAELLAAQAAGDLASLVARGRRVARVSLQELEAALA
ncbi:MAG: transaldolase, partial [Dehalococcoidia bacterium]